MESRSKYLQIALFGAFFFMFIVVINNILSIGDKFGEVHIGIETGFYLVTASLFIYLIVMPVAGILRMPKTRISDFMTDDIQLDDKKVEKTVKQMLRSEYIDEIDKDHLREAVKEGQAELAIKDIYLEKASKIEAEVEDSSSLVLLTTAISQNGILDAVSIMYYNVRMIKRIIIIAGFRPSVLQLMKMIRDIFITAFIFNTIEEINPEEMLEDVLDASGEKLFGKIISKISGSFIQGCFSAYITLKIGYVTKYWLYMTDQEFKEKNIKKQSRTEARKVLVTKVMKRTVGVVPKQAAEYAGKVFSRKSGKSES